MPGQCTRVRITEVGGFAGNVPRPPRVDIARGGLDETQSRSMDEACRQLFALAGPDPAAAPAQVGADLHGYSVEIETENGETRTFKVPFRGRGGGALGGTGIDAVIKQLESLSPPAR